MREFLDQTEVIRYKLDCLLADITRARDNATGTEKTTLRRLGKHLEKADDQLLYVLEGMKQ